MSESRLQADFVELIVREVIRRLLENGVSVNTCNGTSLAATSVAEVKAIPSSDLVLSERLVTMETLRERLQGVTKVTVIKKAIVTPAVRDELKRKKIELIRK